ncbi:MAG TPA: hypothetical protein VIM89_13465 [Mucilaginibacter sp.]
MSKIKKLWKVLAGSISWNLKAPDMSDTAMKDSKKSRQKEAHHDELKKGLAG